VDGQRQSGFDLYHNKRDANTGGFYGVDSKAKTSVASAPALLVLFHKSPWRRTL
jgi:hypothetical protein